MIKVAINQEIIKKGCLEIVTVNGRPFSSLKDSGFSKILTPIIAAFDADKPKISPRSMKENVIAEAERIRQKIKKDLNEVRYLLIKTVIVQK